MATLAQGSTAPIADDNRFFLRAAIAMTIVIVAGFSLHLAAGRSSFSAPPVVHAHAIVFMGWVAIYLLQNIFAATNNRAPHRRLGWVAAGWMVAMVVMGCAITAYDVRIGHVPFFFRPQHFLVFNPLSLFTFVGLAIAAIRLRRRTDWHQRLHYCGMSMLLGPGFGRLLPLPLLEPVAFEVTFVALMIFPVVGIARDLRVRGQVHPAWWWGVGVMIGSLMLAEVITYSPIGDALYHFVATGSPGAALPGLAFGSPPPGL
jgi:hypothetical protein